MSPRRPPVARPVASLLLVVALLAACSAEPSDRVGGPGTTVPGGSAVTSEGEATTSAAEAGDGPTGRALVTAPSVRPLVPSTTTTTTDPAATPFAELQVGDCVDLPGIGLPETVEVETALRRDCTEPHGVEIYAAGPVEEDPEVAYPGDEAVVEAADELCLASFAAYVGVEYVDSALEVLHLRPDESAWSQGDRTVHCGVYDPTSEPLVGSVRGSAR